LGKCRHVDGFAEELLEFLHQQENARQFLAGLLAVAGDVIHSDEDALAALRLQLKKLLEADAALAQELARLLEQARASGQTVIAGGNRSVAIGGDASGSVIVTGDRNRVVSL